MSDNLLSVRCTGLKLLRDLECYFSAIMLRNATLATKLSHVYIAVSMLHCRRLRVLFSVLLYCWQYHRLRVLFSLLSYYLAVLWIDLYPGEFFSLLDLTLKNKHTCVLNNYCSLATTVAWLSNTLLY